MMIRSPPSMMLMVTSFVVAVAVCVAHVEAAQDCTVNGFDFTSLADGPDLGALYPAVSEQFPDGLSYIVQQSIMGVHVCAPLQTGCIASNATQDAATSICAMSMDMGGYAYNYADNAGDFYNTPEITWTAIANYPFSGVQYTMQGSWAGVQCQNPYGGPGQWSTTVQFMCGEYLIPTVASTPGGSPCANTFIIETPLACPPGYPGLTMSSTTPSTPSHSKNKKKLHQHGLAAAATAAAAASPCGFGGFDFSSLANGPDLGAYVNRGSDKLGVHVCGPLRRSCFHSASRSAGVTACLTTYRNTYAPFVYAVGITAPLWSWISTTDHTAGVQYVMNGGPLAPMCASPTYTTFSTTVQFVCGPYLSTTATTTSETCLYIFTITTPLACAGGKYPMPTN